jgi:hypothetical protein
MIRTLQRCNQQKLNDAMPKRRPLDTESRLVLRDK